jgi:hypothetical protein
MAEVLAEFPDPIVAATGSAYRAQAVGAPMDGGLWEGWIEFVPLAGGTPLRSARETTQPNRRDAAYWATGLTAVYLEGALDRAMNPIVRHRRPPATPLFDEPAQGVVTADDLREPGADAILDPFSVYEKSESLLRQQLGALDAWHLVNIIVAYRLSDEPIPVLNRLPSASLVDAIVAAVREQAPARP